MSLQQPTDDEVTDSPGVAVWLVGFLLLALLVAALVFVSGCAPRHVDADPDRVFRYGELQFEERAGLFVLTEQSLERNDETRGLLIDSTVPDDVRMCLDIPRRDGHTERCTTVGEMRRGR